MPTANEWRDERATTLSNAKKIVARAKAANRDLTSTEQSTLTNAMDRVKTIDTQLKGRALVNSVMQLGSSEDFAEHHRGGLFTETAAKDLVTAVKTRSSYRTEVSAKAALTHAVVPTAGEGVEPGLYPSAVPLSTLFRNEEAPGPSIRYYRLGDATADVVEEFGTKPDSGVTITPVDVLLSKVATTVKFSDEFAEDAAFLLAFLQRELTSAVITKENAEVLATFNATSGVLTGTGEAAAVIDLVADAIAGQEALNGSTPSAVVVNPSALATIRKAKAATGGDYFVDPLAGSLTTIHGVKVVSTPATPAGTAWVVNGAGVVVYRRGGITAEIGLTADDFQTNQRTMRVEERFATAVVRPSMLTRLTLT
jgi:HK97 family phage major capsid protein